MCVCYVHVSRLCVMRVCHVWVSCVCVSNRYDDSSDSYLHLIEERKKERGDQDEDTPPPRYASHSSSSSVLHSRGSSSSYANTHASAFPPRLTPDPLGSAHGSAVSHPSPTLGRGVGGEGTGTQVGGPVVSLRGLVDSVEVAEGGGTSPDTQRAPLGYARQVSAEDCKSPEPLVSQAGLGHSGEGTDGTSVTGTPVLDAFF